MLKRFIVLFLGCFVVAAFCTAKSNAGLADSPWSMYQRNAMHTGWSPANGPESPDVKWTLQLPAEVINSQLIIDNDGVLYIAASNGNIYAVNNDGTIKWEYTADSSIRSTGAIGDNGIVYFSHPRNGDSRKNLYAVTLDGDLFGIYDSGYYVYADSPPTIGEDGTIYFAYGYNGWTPGRGGLLAINPDMTLKWEWKNTKASASPTIGRDGTIYCGFIDGNLYAFSPDGNVLWSFSSGNIKLTSSASIGPDDTIYVGSRNNKVFAIYPNGSKKWEYSVGGIVDGTLAIGSDGNVYFGSRDGYVYSLFPDGTLNYKTLTGGAIAMSVALDCNNNAYAGSEDGFLYAIGVDGNIKWKVEIGGYLWSSPSIGKDGTIYITNVNGMIYAVGESKIPVSIDIKPGSCDNPLNTSTQGVLPVAILGNEDLDVTLIDPVTIRLEGVAPLRSSIEDVGIAYNCGVDGPDGFPDLTLKFDTQDIVAALGEVADGVQVNLKLTGELTDGTAIEGEDVVLILMKDKGKSKGKKK
jgi:outer membrane protein assembly factor BamB